MLEMGTRKEKYLWRQSSRPTSRGTNHLGSRSFRCGTNCRSGPTGRTASTGEPNSLIPFHCFLILLKLLALWEEEGVSPEPVDDVE